VNCFPEPPRTRTPCVPEREPHIHRLDVPVVNGAGDAHEASIPCTVDPVTRQVLNCIAQAPGIPPPGRAMPRGQRPYPRGSP
jgi:hypothetical protein